jgi:hypothetical protein
VADNGGRTGARYRRLCARVKEEEPYCYFCGALIPAYLRSPDPASFALHHKIPLGRGGDLHDRANATASHRRCNELSFPCFQVDDFGDLVTLDQPASRTRVPDIPIKQDRTSRIW